MTGGCQVVFDSVFLDGCLHHQKTLATDIGRVEVEEHGPLGQFVQGVAGRELIESHRGGELGKIP